MDPALTVNSKFLANGYGSFRSGAGRVRSGSRAPTGRALPSRRTEGGNNMTVAEQRVLKPFEPVTFNTYRDIHTGIRAELFALTASAGNLDPYDRASRADLARHVQSVLALLVSHAEHEDAVVQPVLEAELPGLAAQIATDHPHIEAQIEEIRDLAVATVDAPDADLRDDVFRVYMELASFTSAYLTHQDFEERDVMPAL